MPTRANPSIGQFANLFAEIRCFSPGTTVSLHHLRTDTGNTLNWAVNGHSITTPFLKAYYIIFIVSQQRIQITITNLSIENQMIKYHISHFISRSLW